MRGLVFVLLFSYSMWCLCCLELFLRLFDWLIGLLFVVVLWLMRFKGLILVVGGSRVVL